MAQTNHAFRLASRPTGLPTADNWDYVEEPVPEPDDGRGAGRGAVHLARPGDARLDERRPLVHPARGHRRGHARARRRPGRRLPPRQLRRGRPRLRARWACRSYAVADGNGLTKVDPDRLPLPVYLSALGMPGMTAYFGLLDIGQPEEGETVVVSGAAGAVGQVVGQIAKIKGCRVVGIAGRPGEVRLRGRTSSGFDAAIDYKDEDVRRKALREHCPDGDRRLLRQRRRRDPRRRAGAAGAQRARRHLRRDLAVQRRPTVDAGPGELHVAAGQPRQHDRLRGVRLRSTAGERQAQEMAGWMAAGKLRSREDVVEGLRDAFPTRCSSCSGARTSGSWCWRWPGTDRLPGGLRLRTRRHVRAGAKARPARQGMDARLAGDAAFDGRDLRGVIHHAQLLLHAGQREHLHHLGGPAHHQPSPNRARGRRRGPRSTRAARPSPET